MRLWIATLTSLTLTSLTLTPAPSLAKAIGAGHAPPIVELHSVDAAAPLRISQANSPGYQPYHPQLELCVGGVDCRASRRAYKDALELALSADPNWAGARTRQVLGIVLTSAAGGMAVILGFCALLSTIDFDFGYHGDSPKDQEEASTTTRDLGLAAAGSLVVALAVGLPLLISGTSEVRAIRRRVGRRLTGVALAPGPGQAGLGVRWQF